MASEPYRLERGPRTTSIRSISSTGRSCRAAPPLVTEPTLMPSISTSTWLELLPRIYSAVDLPGPPLLTREIPGNRCSSSGTDWAWLRSICWRSMTVSAAMLALAACSVRVEVTTCCCSVRGDAWRAPIGVRPSSAKAVGRKAVLPIKMKFSVAPPARHCRGWAYGEQIDDAPPQDGARPATPSAMPWIAAGRSPGLRAEPQGSPIAPSHAGGHSGWMRSLSRLPLRGQRRNCAATIAERTGFPVSPL